MGVTSPQISPTQYTSRNTMCEMFIIDGHNLLYAIFRTEGDSEIVGDVGLCRQIRCLLEEYPEAIEPEKAGKRAGGEAAGAERGRKHIMA